MGICDPRSALEFALFVFLPGLTWMSGQALHFLFSPESAGSGLSLSSELGVSGSLPASIKCSQYSLGYRTQAVRDSSESPAYWVLLILD